MLIGYARVSTSEQNSNLQIDALTAAGCEHIFEDSLSGMTRCRPALDQALRALNPGDTFVTWKLDRLGRSLSHLISLITELEGRDIGFKSVSEAIDTRTASGRLMFHVLGALAEFERSLISERTRAGLAAAKLRGAKLGRPPKLNARQVRRAIHCLQSCSLRRVARRFAVSPLTLKRAINAIAVSGH